PPTPPLSLHDALPISSSSGPAGPSGPGAPSLPFWFPLAAAFLTTTPNGASVPPFTAVWSLSPVLPVPRRSVPSAPPGRRPISIRSEEHTSELQSRFDL